MTNENETWYGRIFNKDPFAVSNQTAAAKGISGALQLSGVTSADAGAKYEPLVPPKNQANIIEAMREGQQRSALEGGQYAGQQVGRMAEAPQTAIPTSRATQAYAPPSFELERNQVRPPARDNLADQLGQIGGDPLAQAIMFGVGNKLRAQENAKQQQYYEGEQGAVNARNQSRLSLAQQQQNESQFGRSLSEQQRMNDIAVAKEQRANQATQDYLTSINDPAMSAQDKAFAKQKFEVLTGRASQAPAEWKAVNVKGNDAKGLPTESTQLYNPATGQFRTVNTGNQAGTYNTPNGPVYRSASGAEKSVAQMSPEEYTRLTGNPYPFQQAQNPNPQRFSDLPEQERAAMFAPRGYANGGEVDVTPYGYAEGGAIPVGGRQVLGPGTGKSDSIPAVIDGNIPAALSNGEYVIPVEVVRAKGTEFFDRLVKQVREKDAEKAKEREGQDQGYAMGGFVGGGLPQLTNLIDVSGLNFSGMGGDSRGYTPQRTRPQDTAQARPTQRVNSASDVRGPGQMFIQKDTQPSNFTPYEETDSYLSAPTSTPAPTTAPTSTPAPSPVADRDRDRDRDRGYADGGYIVPDAAVGMQENAMRRSTVPYGTTQQDLISNTALPAPTEQTAIPVPTPQKGNPMLQLLNNANSTRRYAAPNATVTAGIRG